MMPPARDDPVPRATTRDPGHGRYAGEAAWPGAPVRCHRSGGTGYRPGAAAAHRSVTGADFAGRVPREWLTLCRDGGAERGRRDRDMVVDGSTPASRDPQTGTIDAGVGR